MTTRHYLGIADYIVIGLTLLISAAIGVFFRVRGGRQKTVGEFLMAGRDMSKFPVIFSITVTMTSATTMISLPAEVYKYGTQSILQAIGQVIGIIVSSYVFLPVYFQCEVSTVYEYLEMRFGKFTRYAVSSAFVVQMVIYMSVVLYTAVLALSAVTNLSFEMSIISVGVCCAFYCSLGGLKAVLWTDVFQCFLMVSCVLTVCVAGVSDVGGIARMFSLSKQGQRLELFNFSLDLTKRYTFWNCLLRGMWQGVGYYGVGQAEVQRMLSMRNVDRAKSVLLLSVVPVFIFQLLCLGMGLILYGVYHSCDPLMNHDQTGLTKYEQLIPYYVVSRVGSVPGLTGLCIAGIFSGSLSSLSSALNALSTVTVIDFLKPLFPNHLNDKRSLLFAKCLTAVYGVICICCALSLKNMESVKNAVNTLMSLVEGPTIAIFTIAVFTRKASDKCTLFGLLTSLPIIGWLAFGSLFGKYRETILPVSSSRCNETFSAIQRNSSILTSNTPKDFSHLPFLYKMSFNWFPIIGTLLTLTATFLAVIITGWKRNVIPPDSKCLSPVTRFWRQKSAGESTNTEMPTLESCSGKISNADRK